MPEYQGFGTHIGCMDGRPCGIIADWLKKEYGVVHPDMVTEEGLLGIISRKERIRIELIKHKALISLHKHNSPVLVVTAHGDCAANTVEKKQQIAQLYQSCEEIRSWGRWKHEHGIWIGEDLTLEILF